MMNKRDRMEALFHGEKTDRIPAGFWFHYPSDYTPSQHAGAHLKLFRETDQDVLKLMDDNFGHFLTEGIVIEKASDWRKIRLPGRDCAHYRNMEALIREIVREAGKEAMVFPTVWSPFKIASFTYVFSGSSDEKFMEHCKEDPDSVLAGVNAIADVLADWTKGYLDAGADGIYYSGQFSEPARFEKEEWEHLVKPSDLQILDTVHARDGKYNIVHICGEAEHNFQASPERYGDYPGDLFNWDVHRDNFSLEQGRDFFQKPILGGLDNHGLLIHGSVDEIEKETRRIIESFGKKGLMIGADCTVPADIPLEKLKAAIRAARE